MHPTIERMIASGRPADEVSLVADGLAFRWLIGNGTIQPDERGDWSIVYIETPSVPMSRGHAADELRLAAGAVIDD